MRFLLLLKIIFFWPLTGLEFSALDELHRNSHSAVCEMIGYKQSESETFQAFFIDPRGYLLTDQFLTTWCDCFYCFWPDDEGCLDMLEGRLIAVHPDYDVALIKVDSPNGRAFPFLELDYHPLKPGDWLLRISTDALHNFNMPFLCSVSQYFQEADETILPHEGIVDGGSISQIWGAPYLNFDGKVVAVHNFSYSRFSLFIALHPLQEWLSTSLTKEKK